MWERRVREVARSAFEPPLVLALDVGTSSLRAVVFDRQGRPLEGCGARVAYEIESADDGTAVLAPARLVDCIVQALDRVHRALSLSGLAVAGVGVDTFASSCLGVDALDVPLTPVYLWADTRPSPDAAAMRRELDERATHERTGCPIHSAYLPARVRWLRRAHPEIATRVRRWVSFGEYLELRLFGTARVSLSIASWGGLLNRHTLGWDPEWLRLLELDEHNLSPLVDRDAPLSEPRREWAARWPLFARVPWFPAIGDGASANVSSGCLGASRAALTIGTSGAMRVVLSEPVERVPWGLWCYRVDRRQALLGGALSEGGNLYAWLAQTTRLGDAALVEAELATMEPDAHGLTMLPFLAGERSPGWAGRARAAIMGLGLNTSPREILRAGLEAIAYRFALLDRLLSQVAQDDRHLLASGVALLGSPAWLQIMADVLGRPLTVSEEEATARGTALLALDALRQLPSGVEGVEHQRGETYRPDRERHAQYQFAIERQSALYRLLIDRDAQDERRDS